MEAPIPSTVSHGFYRRWGKRLLDLFLSLVGLVVFSPVLILVALLVRLRLGFPVLFRQSRPGLNAEPFLIYKFRTMADHQDRDGNPLLDVERLDSFGRALRRASLDELPELFNVLKGDMSIVGPRPLLIKYMPYYTNRERGRFSVRPGITGWAQVHGRNEATWDERLENDVWYVEHQSLGLDLRIIALTVLSVFLGKGVVDDPRSIMLNLDEERQQGASSLSSPSGQKDVTG